MAVETDRAGLVTTRYAKFLNPLPEVNSARSFFKLVPAAQRNGSKFSYPLRASNSHGQTQSVAGGAFSLNAARGPVILTAELDAPDLVMRETLSYSLDLRTRNGVSIDGNAGAYYEGMDFTVESLLNGMELYSEIQVLHGNGAGSTIVDDLGVVATTAVFAGTGPNYGSGTHPLVQLTSASWAPGLWNAMGGAGAASGGALVDIINAAGTAIVETDVIVEGIGDPSLCQVQLFKSGSAVAVAAGHRLIPKSWFQNSCVGAGGILKNTGTFAGINAAAVSLWRARSANAAGPLTIAKLQQYIAKLSNTFGNKKTGLVGFVNALTFQEMCTETTNATRWNNSMGSNSAKQVGTDTLELLSAVGSVKLISHPYQKQGQAFFFDPDNCERVGASDITTRGADGKGSITLELANAAGTELRAISQQAPILRLPNRNLIVTGIASTGADSSGS